MPRRGRDTEAVAIEITIENHVAGRIRLRRGLLGMSQSDLASALGITFQQVQKYERGSNRVSVGKLYRLAEILGVPLGFFFDGLAGSPKAVMADAPANHLGRRELDLLHLWTSAPGDVRDEVLALLRAVGGMLDGQPDSPVPALPPANPQPEEPAHPTPAPARAKIRAAERPAPRRRRRGAVWDPADIKGEAV
jgi:transcriptional regulator with XRE-family HTH domain